MDGLRSLQNSLRPSCGYLRQTLSCRLTGYVGNLQLGSANNRHPNRCSMRVVTIPNTPEEWDAWKADVQRSLENGREGILTRMGYRDYDHYLASYLWRKIKKRIKEKYDATCFRCGGHASEVHHRSYTEAVLKGEDDDQLRPLCGGCHDIVEFD